MEIAEILSLQGVLANLKAGSKKQLLQELAAVAAKETGIVLIHAPLQISTRGADVKMPIAATKNVDVCAHRSMVGSPTLPILRQAHPSSSSG